MSIMRFAKEFFYGPEDDAYYEYDEAADYDRRDGYRDASPREDSREAAYRDVPPRREVAGARDYGYERDSLREPAAARPRGYDDYQAAVRPAPAVAAEPSVVALSLVSYDEARKMGEAFRDGDIVVFEITDAERGVAKRIIDFSAGLCFALRGQMKNITAKLETDRKIFAIIPEQAQVTNIDLERAAGLR
ncbi:cell division protein SepF [Corynebacterium sp. MNWGS58]|uniref:cell division protein SepF n=1 Tax=Corynebacterium sp. 102791.4 TaxID=3104612 RepID=UPI003518AAE8